MPVSSQVSLSFSQVDPHSPIPLYYQIYLDLKQVLQKGAILPGSRLPAETEICRGYRVGRQTVRQALAMLEDENLVERFPGRGTFLRENSRSTRFFLDRSFSRQMHELGRQPHSQVIRVEKGWASVQDIPALQDREGAACVTIERLRLGDNEPICHQVSCVLSERCPGIEQHDFSTASLYEILASEYQLIIHRIDHEIRAVAAVKFIADLLSVREGTAMLFVNTAVYTDDGELIEFSNSHYRADLYTYRTTQTCCD